MNDKSIKQFKNSLEDSYVDALGVKSDAASQLALDYTKYAGSLKEIDDDEDENLVVKQVSKKEMKNIIDKENKKSETEHKKKLTAKQQFATDLQKDKDFEEFKKNAKYEKGGTTFTFGVPNVSSEDPYIKKKTKYGRPGRGKEETKEATGTGSSGPVFGKVAFANTKFVQDSFKETPRLQKEDVEKVEAKEATTGVGGYSTPAMWAKSTNKKDWGPSRKTQYKGGKFVQVKKKCTKFPYCNQGDINALKISNNESVKEAIKNVSKKLNISEKVITNILEQEYNKLNKSNN